ncbi:MAG: iron chelate uptake ABC transporter family permease subunit [Phycisphaerales bacterium]|nr:iron chelate uptake ABC transporter family permease subunit [Phycisphaerales bacterium]
MIPFNTMVVLCGTGLLGVVSGIIGSFAVLRRRALMGDALAHAALPGICLAFLILGERHLPALLLGALITGTVGVLVVTTLRHATRIKEDAAIGIVLSVFFGAGVVLLRVIQNMPSGNRAGLDHYIYGKAAGMVVQDVQWIGGVCLVVILAAVLLYKEFTLLSFDTAFAATLGWPTLRLDIVMMGLLVIVTVVGLPAVGVVMMAAMLIIPGASARFWTERLHVMLILAAVFGGLTGIVGTWLSATFSRLPAGPVIVLVAAAIFVVSMTFAPRRGILARTLSHVNLRRRTARQNLLRTMYELVERDLDARPAVTPAALTRLRAWTEPHARRLLAAGARVGLIERTSDGHFRLTDRGLLEAVGVVRTHRLWEMFLIEQAHIATDHVDRDADSIEHVLGADIIRDLEDRLVQLGRWPHGTARPPRSPHEIAVDGGVTP